MAMKLDDQAIQNVAECFSRGEHLTVETKPAVESGVWCERCGTDSQMVFPLQGISDRGVYDLGTVTACALHDNGDDA